MLINKKVFKSLDRVKTILFVLAIALFGVGLVNQAKATVVGASVTAATGGTNISLDTTSAGSCDYGSCGAWTNLTGPIISENQLGNIFVGTHVLTAPAGWEFNTASTVHINIGDNDHTFGINGDTVGPATATTTATTITFDVTGVSTEDKTTLTFYGIQVRPTGTAVSSGNITYSGPGSIATSNLGALSSAAGAVKVFTLNSPADISAGDRAGYVVTREDQFGNPVGTGLQTAHFYSTSSSGNAGFYDAASEGGIVTSVVIGNGFSTANIWYYDDKVGTYTIAASDNSPVPDAEAGIYDATDSIIVTPGIPGTPTFYNFTPSHSGYINHAEETAGFTVRVTGFGGMAEGDNIDLYLNDSPFKSKTLDATDVSHNYVDFAISHGDLGSDGLKKLDSHNSGKSSASLTFTLDATPPVTTLMCNGSSCTGDWTNATTTVSFSVEDASDPVQTYYCADDVSGPTGACTPSTLYEGPIEVSDPGVTGFHFYSVDSLGNTESQLNVVVRIDPTPPAFASADTTSILLQSDEYPSSHTNTWYYYEVNEPTFKAEVNMASNDDLSSMKAKICIRSFIEITSPDDICSESDFENPANYIESTDLSGNTFTFNSDFGTFPSASGAYQMNVELVDAAGNKVISSGPEQSFVAVLGINPKFNDVSLNNASTTDWSIIDDFTAVENLTFSAQNEGGELGRLILEGPINLTSSATVEGLNNFASNVEISGSKIRIDTDALASLNTHATLIMNVGSGARPGLIVKDNDGAVLGYVANNASSDVTVGEHTIGGFSWNDEAKTITFTTTGFSEYDTDNTAPTVTALGDGESDYQLPFIPTGPRPTLYGTALVFSEELGSAGKTAVENALSAGADKTLGFVWGTGSGANRLRVSYEGENEDGSDTATFANDVYATISDKAGNTSINAQLIDSATGEGEYVASGEETVIEQSDLTAVIDKNASTTIDVPNGITGTIIDVNSLTDGLSGTLPQITINATTSVGLVNVAIPDGTVVTGETGWDSKINVPAVKENSSVSVTGGTVDSVIEIGANTTPITFDKGVRIQIAGKAGKKAGYSRGSVFTEITDTCAADTQKVGDDLAPGGDCKINVEGDLVIWTKHFTSFVTFTATSTGSSGGACYNCTIYVPPAPATTSTLTITQIPVPDEFKSPSQIESELVAILINSEDMQIGYIGKNVINLQKFLNLKGFKVSVSGAGSPGNESNYFGAKTKIALAKWQKSVGIKPASGYFGKITRAYIKNIKY